MEGIPSVEPGGPSKVASGQASATTCVDFILRYCKRSACKFWHCYSVCNLVKCSGLERCLMLHDVTEDDVRAANTGMGPYSQQHLAELIRVGSIANSLLPFRLRDVACARHASFSKVRTRSTCLQCCPRDTMPLGHRLRCLPCGFPLLRGYTYLFVECVHPICVHCRDKAFISIAGEDQNLYKCPICEQEGYIKRCM